jgi:hypothetical protein
MKKQEQKRVSEVLASFMGDTERGDHFSISQNLIGFQTDDAAKLLQKYISLQPEEMLTWENSLAGVDPIYYSQSEHTAHTAKHLLETDDAENVLSVSSQEQQLKEMNFLPTFELIARMGNTSGKCFRMAMQLENYYEKVATKPVTLGVLKLAVNLLYKMSDQTQNNIQLIRNRLMYTMDMQLNFEGKKLELLKSKKAHLVPNIDNFFKMREHKQVRYFDPLNWYFEVYKDTLKDIPHKLYQDVKHHKEAQQAMTVYSSIVEHIKSAHNVVTGVTKTPF